VTWRTCKRALNAVGSLFWLIIMCVIAYKWWSRETLDFVETLAAVICTFTVAVDMLKDVVSRD
jgi:hypothetical protein